MKKVVFFVLIFCLLWTSAFAERYYYDGKWSEHDEAVKLYVDGTKIYCDIPPLIVDGRTLVPVRAFFEKLGATVVWEADKRQVTVIHGDNVGVLKIDSTDAIMNGKNTKLDVTAKIITDKNGTGRTMIPVRFVSEKLGFDVEWDDDTYSVMITSKKPLLNITSIKQRAVNESDVIEVRLEGKTKPKIMTLSNPSRLVMDFYGYDFDFSKTAFKGGETYSALRYALHEEYARVVLDMTCMYSYSVKDTDGLCTLTVTKTGDLVEDKDSTAKTDTKTDTKTEAKTETKTDTKTDSKTSTNQAQNEKINSYKSVAGKGLVVIDPGHGGSDPGAIGYKDDEIYLKEADANLDIALKVYKILQKAGVKVALTRTKDEWVDLYDRAPFANELDASFFISIHNNSAEAKTAHGTSVYYYTGELDEATKEKYGITSKESAQIILTEMIKSTGLYDRKIQDGSRLVVLKYTQMPGVLTECAFVSNDEEMELLSDSDFTQDMAEGIANGVLKVLKKMGIR